MLIHSRRWLDVLALKKMWVGLFFVFLFFPGLGTKGSQQDTHRFWLSHILFDAPTPLAFG